MVRTVADLYNDFKLLIKQWVYDKTEIDNLLDNKADAQSLNSYYTKSEIDEIIGDIEEDMQS